MTLPFILESDASFNALGAVLSQQQGGTLVVLGYASCGNRDSEKNMSNYSSVKLELLGLKWAVAEKFRDLLIGANFVVYTDNNRLSYVKTTGKLGATETRWAAELAQFDFTIKYRSGRSNQNADSLSRKSQHGKEPKSVRFAEVVACESSMQFVEQMTVHVPRAVHVTTKDVLGTKWVGEVTTLKLQHYTDLPKHEHLTLTPPIVETAGEYDEMLQKVTDEDTTQHPKKKELRRSQRTGAGCHSNPHHEPRSAVQAIQHELQQSRLTDCRSAAELRRADSLVT